MGIHADVNNGVLQIDGSLTVPSFNVFNGAQVAGAGTVITTGAGVFYTSSAASTFGGTFSGPGPLEVDSGSLALGGSNTYGGATTLTGGVLQLGVNNALPIGTAATFGYGASGGTLDLAGNNQQVAGLAIDPSVVTGAAGNVIGNSSTASNSLLIFNSASSSTFAGTIQDALGAGTQKTALDVSAGTLVLSGTNTYSGGTTMNNGMLVIANTAGSALGSGTLTLNGGILAAGPAGGSVSGLVQAGSAAHTIAPGAGLSSGYGTLYLNGGLNANNYTTLAFNLNQSTSSSLGGNGEPVYVGDMINLGGSGLSGSGNFTFGGVTPAIGDYRLMGGALGSPTLSNFTLPAFSGTADTYTLSTTADPGNLDLVVASAATFSGSATWIATGGGAVWSASGNWADNSSRLSGVPGTSLSRTADTAAFNGTDSAPTITLDVSPSLAALSFSGTNYTLSGSGTLTMNGGTAGATIAVAGGTQSIASAVQIAGGNLVVAASNYGLLALSGSVADDGSQRSLTLTGDGSGQLVLGGSNSYTGGTYIEQGTLVANDNGSIPDQSGLIVGAGGTFLFDPTVTGSALDATSLHAASQVNPVPEPATLALLAAAGTVAAAAAWRRKKGSYALRGQKW